MGAVVALAMVGCRGWCIGCWWWRCSWIVGSPRPARWWCWWCRCSLRPLATPGVPGLARGGGGGGEALVGGFDGGWRDWWVAAVGGCRLLVRLSLSVFRLVLVMVSLVVQMVGGG